VKCKHTFFPQVEYCHKHFVYGFCDGNACAAVQEYQRRFPVRRIPSRCLFTRIHQTLRDTGSLPSVYLQSKRYVVRTINTRTLHEEELYPYHDQRVKHLEPGDYAQRMDLCHWVTAHPELLSLILFTDETSFTRDGVNNLRNVHTWSHRNPHATCVTHFQRRFSVNLWCGVLGNRLIGPYTSGLLPLGPHEDLSLRNLRSIQGQHCTIVFLQRQTT